MLWQARQMSGLPLTLSWSALSLRLSRYLLPRDTRTLAGTSVPLRRSRSRRLLGLRRLLLLLDRRLARRSLLQLLSLSRLPLPLSLPLPRRAHDPVLHRKLLHQLALHLRQMMLLLLRLERLELRVLEHAPPCRREMCLLFERERELCRRAGMLLLLLLLLLRWLLWQLL